LRGTRVGEKAWKKWGLRNRAGATFSAMDHLLEEFAGGTDRKI